MDDKEKSVIDKFKDMVAEVVGKMGCAMAPTAEEKDKEVAATTNEQVYTDSTTGEKITYREIKVSTKLADPEMVKRMEEEIARLQGKPTP